MAATATIMTVKTLHNPTLAAAIGELPGLNSWMDFLAHLSSVETIRLFSTLDLTRKKQTNLFENLAKRANRSTFILALAKKSAPATSGMPIRCCLVHLTLKD